MKYKIGDKVVIRKDLVRGKEYYMRGNMDCKYSRSCICNEVMVNLGGLIATIDRYEHDRYRLREFDFYWTDEMFDGLYSDLPDIDIKNLV